jgi:disease resistance protein
MDWDEFMRIPGCAVSFHSEIKPSRPLSAEKAISESLTPQPSPLLVSTESGPPTLEIEQTKAARVQVPMMTKDGFLKCKHAGCQKEYDPHVNSDSSCEYHEGAAGFRDTKKFWTCCGASSYDWDEFLKIPKCKIGPHEPKLVDA